MEKAVIGTPYLVEPINNVELELETGAKITVPEDSVLFRMLCNQGVTNNETGRHEEREKMS